MFKKIITTATMLCVLPVMAHAWTLNTWVKSQGGTIASSNGAAQTVKNGSVLRNYTTSGTENVIVTPEAGFKVSRLEINGITQTTALFPSLADPTAVQTVTKARSGKVRVFSTFARQSFALSAVANANGSVDKTTYSKVYIGSQSPFKTFTFTPNPGFAVTGIVASAGTPTVTSSTSTPPPTSRPVLASSVKK